MLSKIRKGLAEPHLIVPGLAACIARISLVSDKAAVDLRYRSLFHSRVNFENPRGFNEKLQWLKLHDRNPQYVRMVDKILAKEWASNLIGSDHVPKIYGVWDDFGSIPFEDLPQSFVLKTNHDSGGVVICPDSRSLDKDSARKKLTKHLRKNYFYGGREWPYGQIDRKIFAEQYLLSENFAADLADYKLFCFPNGRIVTLVCENRFSDGPMNKTFLDEDWNNLPIVEGGHPINDKCKRPDGFCQMKEFASLLSEGLPFARVDFFESNGTVYFGELTLYPNSGYERFAPEEWDTIFGSWVDLTRAYSANE